MSILASLPVSAVCPVHPQKTITSCSGIHWQTNPDGIRPCVWAGGNGGGSYHGTNCYVEKTYKYTKETCSLCSYNNPYAGNHYCWYWHVSATPNISGSICPY